jgi:U3 small nucleolar ribonucleoprotein protein IMP4
LCGCSVTEGKPLPSELKKEARQLKNKVELDDARTEGCYYSLVAWFQFANWSRFFVPELKSMIDDEYSTAGTYEPKILITTSRDPSSKLVQFVKVCSLIVISAFFPPYLNFGNQEMKLCFPNSQRINRGNAVVKDLVAASRSIEITDLIIVHEHRGQPGLSFIFLLSPIRVMLIFSLLQTE